MTELRTRIRVSDARKQLGMANTTARRHIANGVLPKPHRIGRVPYWFADELEAALTEAAKATEAEAA